jgi:hypothetical protein
MVTAGTTPCVTAHTATCPRVLPRDASKGGNGLRVEVAEFLKRYDEAESRDMQRSSVIGGC